MNTVRLFYENWRVLEMKKPSGNITLFYGFRYNKRTSLAIKSYKQRGITMAIRALFLDIDGTLLNTHQLISEKTKKRLVQFQESGGVVILSSARPYIGMKPYGEELHLPEYGGYYLAFNGGHLVNAASLDGITTRTFSLQNAAEIVHTVQKIESEALHQTLPSIQEKFTADHFLTLKNAWEIHDAVDKNSLNIMTYNKETLVMMRLEVYAAAEALVNHMNISVKPDFLGALTFEPIKFLISGDPAFIHKVYPALKSQLPKHEVVTSDPFFMEVTPKGINKGNALETLADKLGIPLSETVAVGDSVNDLAMIERAGIGVAMGNASEQVKQAADFVTKTNDEDGISYFLDQFS